MAGRPVHALLNMRNGRQMKSQHVHRFFPLMIFAPEKWLFPDLPMAARLWPLPGLTLTLPYGGTAVARTRSAGTFRLIPNPPPRLGFWNDVFMGWRLSPKRRERKENHQPALWPLTFFVTVRSALKILSLFSCASTFDLLHPLSCMVSFSSRILSPLSPAFRVVL